MNVKFLPFLFFALSSLLLVNVNSALAKEQPLPELMGMFENFNVLEEQFRDGQWDKAIEKVSTIESDYKAMVPKLKGTVSGETIQKFSFLIGGFKKKLAEKESEGLEKPFVNLQSLFLDIMDHYAYPSPPVLLIISRYVGEAKESLEKGNFADVGEEMEEIASFQKRTITAMQENAMDIAKGNALFEHAEKVEQAAKAGNKEESEKLLAEMESEVGALVKK